MNYQEAKTKAQKVLVQGDPTYNFAQSEMMRDEIIGSTYETRSGKMVEVVEHTTDNNNIIIKIGNDYDAVAGVWFIAHIEKGSFVKQS